MKVYVFSGAETEWVAAHSLEEAKECLMNHYGISMEDIIGSYEEIEESSPNDVEFYTDKVDDVTGEYIIVTGTTLIGDKNKPFVLMCSAW